MLRFNVTQIYSNDDALESLEKFCKQRLLQDADARGYYFDRRPKVTYSTTPSFAGDLPMKTITVSNLGLPFPEDDNGRPA